MIEYFDIIYSDEVDKFLKSIDEKARDKIIYESSLKR
jgi:hypothetical protein